MKKALVVLAVALVIIFAVFALKKNSKISQNAVFDNPFSQHAFSQAGLSKLHVAVIKRDSKTVLELLDKGADPNSTSADGTSPLHSACVFGPIQCVEILLDHGANIEARDAGGNTPLTIAASAGQPEIVKLLLKRGARLDVRNSKGNTPLQAVLFFKDTLSSNPVAKRASSGLRDKLDQCAQLLREHGAK